jgi:uncharacterized membrane protein YkvA (DUF1232 family)
MRIFRLWRASGRDLRLLWFALRHPARPLWLLPTTAFLVFYAVDPLNVVAPALGVLDDFVLLPMLLHGLLKLLPLNVRGDFSADRPPDAVQPGR